MKYLEYLGDLYYTVHKDFNGILRYPKKNAVLAFYYGDCSLEELKDFDDVIVCVGAWSPGVLTLEDGKIVRDTAANGGI